MSTSNTTNTASAYNSSATQTISTPQERFSILVISSDSQNIKDCLDYYSENIKVAIDYTEAKKQIQLVKPELIIFNLPLHQLSLVEFKVWLTATGNIDIPVIYNQMALKGVNIKQLFKQKLVDDVVNISDTFTRLHFKAKFIKRLHTKNNSITRLKHKIGKSTILPNLLLRTIDVFISALALICLMPTMLIIGIAIIIDSRGPIFYRSYRAGKGFKVFTFFKFRTMIVDADKKIDEFSSFNMYHTENNQPHFFKLENDPRITKLGRFLRNSSLDEIPQLYNVLRGDMSIVGNRPLPLYEASTLTTNEWAERFMAPAGITGLWQITKRGGAEMSSEERIQLDIYYARNRSISGDLKILFQTPTALMQKANV